MKGKNDTQDYIPQKTIATAQLIIRFAKPTTPFRTPPAVAAGGAPVVVVGRYGVFVAGVVEERNGLSGGVVVAVELTSDSTQPDSLTVLVEVDVVVVVTSGVAEPSSSEHDDDVSVRNGVHPWQGPPGV